MTDKQLRYYLNYLQQNSIKHSDEQTIVRLLTENANLLREDFEVYLRPALDRLAHKGILIEELTPDGKLYYLT